MVTYQIYTLFFRPNSVISMESYNLMTTVCRLGGSFEKIGLHDIKGVLYPSVSVSHPNIHIDWDSKVKPEIDKLRDQGVIIFMIDHRTYNE